MRNPIDWWEDRVRRTREAFIQSPPAAEPIVHSPGDDFGQCDFWQFINPAVAEEARPRFNAGQYADAVEVALKVVAQQVRDKTGLQEDGTSLMNRAFSAKNPLLIFDDPMPRTKDSVQQGYMQMFAGTIMSVRNPKAHSIVKIDMCRCIHFLFLASLLAEKTAEARRAT
jgi:uncharacterized protein (TIGR02391 family)